MNQPDAHAAELSIERTEVAYDAGRWAEETTRFGLIALATDHASENELPRMMPADTVLYTTRVHFDGNCDVANLQSLESELAGAAALLLPGTPLHAIAFGCTSGTVAIGYDRVRATIEAQRSGVPVATPITGARKAFTALGVGRIAMVTPYPEDVNALLVDYMGDAGIDVAAFATFGLQTDLEMTSVPPEAIERAVLELNMRGAEAVFICCTALRAVATIAALERQLGMPVVTSNQAMLWDMMGQAGYQAPVAGFGRLLSATPRSGAEVTAGSVTGH